ncbi:MAG: hypothetical protein OEY23_17280 [Acidimicrobiia bacterium]|nr:hypothetical protein [Acidimicrobiia bacterium]
MERDDERVATIDTGGARSGRTLAVLGAVLAVVVGVLFLLRNAGPVDSAVDDTTSSTRRPVNPLPSTSTNPLPSTTVPLGAREMPRSPIPPEVEGVLFTLRRDGLLEEVNLAHGGGHRWETPFRDGIESGRVAALDDALMLEGDGQIWSWPYGAGTTPVFVGAGSLLGGSGRFAAIVNSEVTTIRSGADDGDRDGGAVSMPLLVSGRGEVVRELPELLTGGRDPSRDRTSWRLVDDRFVYTDAPIDAVPRVVVVDAASGAEMQRFPGWLIDATPTHLARLDCGPTKPPQVELCRIRIGRWDAPDERELPLQGPAERLIKANPRLSPDGSMLVGVPVVDRAAQVTVLDVASGLVRIIDQFATFYELGDEVLDVAFPAAGNYVLVRGLSAATGTQPYDLDDELQLAMLSPGGRPVATAVGRRELAG